MTKGELAEKYFKEGYSCSQSVLLAFAEDAGLDEMTALRISSPFGGGMGRTRGVCGAVSGMLMAAGLLYGYDSVSDKDGKISTYALTRRLLEKFKAENGSIICAELSGISDSGSSVPTERSAEFYKKRPCAELVRTAAEILESVKNEK